VVAVKSTSGMAKSVLCCSVLKIVSPLLGQ
jgi:hypothetical protein